MKEHLQREGLSFPATVDQGEMINRQSKFPFFNVLHSFPSFRRQRLQSSPPLENSLPVSQGQRFGCRRDRPQPNDDRPRYDQDPGSLGGSGFRSPSDREQHEGNMSKNHLTSTLSSFPGSLPAPGYRFPEESPAVGRYGTAVQFALGPAGSKDALHLPRASTPPPEEDHGGPLGREVRQPGSRQGI